MMVEPFSGFVEGMGYVLSEVVVTPYTINKSGTHFMWETGRIEFLYPLEDTYDSADVVNNNPEESKTKETDSDPSIIKNIISGGGMSLNILGNNSVPTRGKVAGATKGTSIASEYFRYSFPFRESPTPPLLKKLPAKIIIPVKNPNLNLPIIGKNRHIPLMQGSATSKLGPALGRITPFAGGGLTIWGAYQSVDNIVTSNYSPKVIAQEAGGWGTAYAGARLGAITGAEIGIFFDGIGAIPGAFFGGIIGGILGYCIGYGGTGEAYDMVIK